MSLFFLINNLHFSFTILGALAFLITAWLALDAFLIRRDFMTAIRGIGFLFLATWQVFHAFDFSADLYIYIGYGFYFLGILFVLWNLILEAPINRPEFKAIFILPAVASLTTSFNSIAGVGLLLITWFAFHQYKKEFKKPLIPFIIGFFLLALGSFTSLFYTHGILSILWVMGHVFEIVGFFALGWWVWSYLQLRIREEMLLIFISITLIMSVMVTLTFSSILVSNIEAGTKANLLTNAKVLNLAIERFKEEALAKVKFVAQQDNIAISISENDFVELERLATASLTENNLGFLAFLDTEGMVLLRAHALTKKDDNLFEEEGVSDALSGGVSVYVAPSISEGLSIRATAPLYEEDIIVGAVIAGFQLDNAFVDAMRKITGLEMSLFEKNTIVATTLVNADGVTRSVGISQVDDEITRIVLEEGKSFVTRTEILATPFLAGYIPLRGIDDNIVGMISASRAQNEIVQIAQATNRLTLVAVIIIMLIFIFPIYTMSRRLSEETG